MEEITLGSLKIPAVLVTAVATLGAALAAGVFATANIMWTRFFDRADKKRLLDSEMRYLMLHYKNSLNALDHDAWVSGESIARMKYRGDTLVIGEASALAKLPIEFAIKALFLEGLVRNTNSELDGTIQGVGKSKLSSGQVEALRFRFHHLLKQIDEARVALKFKPAPPVAY